jgi:hypothetical protein
MYSCIPLQQPAPRPVLSPRSTRKSPSRRHHGQQRAAAFRAKTAALNALGAAAHAERRTKFSANKQLPLSSAHHLPFVPEAASCMQQQQYQQQTVHYPMMQQRQQQQQHFPWPATAAEFTSPYYHEREYSHMASSPYYLPKQLEPLATTSPSSRSTNSSLSNGSSSSRLENLAPGSPLRAPVAGSPFAAQAKNPFSFPIMAPSPRQLAAATAFSSSSSSSSGSAAQHGGLTVGAKRAQQLSSMAAVPAAAAGGTPSKTRSLFTTSPRTFLVGDAEEAAPVCDALSWLSAIDSRGAAASNNSNSSSVNGLGNGLFGDCSASYGVMMTA